MRRLVTVLMGTIAAVTATPGAAFDLQAALLKKIATRAAPAEPTSADATWTGIQSMPSAQPREKERERDDISLYAPTFETRLGRKAFTARFSAGGFSSRAELDYDGDLRLYLDKAVRGGRLRMSFADDTAGGKLRLEFKSSF